MKENATNIDIHSVEKEVKSMVENGLLENRKTCQGLIIIVVVYSWGYRDILVKNSA